VHSGMFFGGEGKLHNLRSSSGNIGLDDSELTVAYTSTYHRCKKRSKKIF